MIRENLKRWICLCSSTRRQGLPCGFLLGTENEGAHASPLLIAFLPTKLQKGSVFKERAGGFRTPDTGRHQRQNKNRRKRSQFQETKMSCYNAVELPPSSENASQSPMPPSRWISHSFFLRVPMEWGVHSCHHRK